jgi:hypothetical protein
MSPEIIGAIVRTVLATLGGGLVADGLLSDTTINAITGGIVAAITLGWSIWQKKKAAKK